MKNLTILALTATCACLAVTSSQANTILAAANTDPYALGSVVPGVDYGNFGGQTGGDVVMVNTLIPLALNATASPLGQQSSPSTPTLYTRSGNAFSPLPTAVTTGASGQSGSGLSIVGGYVEITLGSGFTYLAAKWDGPQGGAMVYDIAGLAAGTVIDLPQTAFGHGMTGWTLIDGTTTVPDGGTTVLLLGAALSGLGLVRRKLS